LTISPGPLAAWSAQREAASPRAAASSPRAPCGDSALARANVVLHLLHRARSPPALGGGPRSSAALAQPVVHAVWQSLLRSKLLLAAAALRRGLPESAPRRAVVARVRGYLL
jgi:hypothetical protein